MGVPGRVLVGEGVLTKMCRKKPKARQFFLFNDILVYGNIVINKKKYNKQHIIPLEEVKLESLDDEGRKLISIYFIYVKDQCETNLFINLCLPFWFVHIKTDVLFPEYVNGWLIRTASKSFAVYAATSTEKQEWMAHINKCIEDLLRKSKS